MNVDFTNKVVIVTGGSGNLGNAVVRAFEAAGATLVLPDRKEGRLAQRFPELATGGHFLADGIDTTRPDGALKLASETVSRFNKIDVLINTVGGYRAGHPLHETSLDTWDLMMSLNAKSVFTLSQAVLPAMIRQQHGSIISAGAKSALAARANESAYAASKAALARITESMAAEYKAYGITVNAVLPGAMDTPQNRAAMPGADFSTWLKPERVAQVMVFLASDAGHVINGALIPVYGRQ